jgi:O-antigen ligase
LLLISVSYWYCLPLISIGWFGYNEFRTYDFLFLALWGLVIGRDLARFRMFFVGNQPAKWLFRFACWCALLSLPTAFEAVIQQKGAKLGIVAIDLYKLWGFLLSYAAFRLYVSTKRQCFLFLDVFLVVGLLEAAVIILQGLGIVGSFWGERYAGYGTMTHSATLGPNRTLPGHSMILVIAVALSYFVNWGTVGFRRLVLGLACAVFALCALVISGSRTAWVTFAVFLLLTLCNRKLGLRATLLFALVALVLICAMPDALKEIGSEMYDYKIGNKLEQSSDSDLVSKFQSVDSGRTRLWTQCIAALASKPWLPVVGVGFVNYGSAFSALSAHNMYLTLLVELGIIGFFLYSAWLYSTWRETERVPALRGRRRPVITFTPSVLRPLIISLAISMTAGEILYVYRPTFAFLGMFLFLCAILNHPALKYGNPQEAPCRASFRISPARRKVPSPTPVGGKA